MPDEIVVKNKENTNLVFPVSSSDFGKFIAGLFKTPRKIARSKRASFDLDIDGIVDTHYLVHQRIADQQSFTLVSFSCEFHYDDGRSIGLRSIEEVREYKELGSRRCVAATLEWVYLIHSSGSEIPNKQTIDLTFYTGLLSEHIDLEGQIPLTAIHKQGKSSVSYYITHTHVSWGYDIANLLDNKIDEIHQPDRMAKLFSGFLGDAVIGLLMLALFFGTSTISLFILFIDREITVEQFLRLESSGLRYLTSFISLFFFTALGGLSVLGGLLLKRYLSRPRPSFIVLSERAKKYRDYEMRRHEKRWLRFMLSVALALSLGIVSSIMAAALWQNYSNVVG